MVDNAFDTDAWLRRIGLERPLLPTLGTLRAVVEAHATTVPFENIDVLLGRVPLLDLIRCNGRWSPAVGVAIALS